MKTAEKLLAAKIPIKIMIDATGLKENEISKLKHKNQPPLNK